MTERQIQVIIEKRLIRAIVLEVLNIIMLTGDSVQHIERRHGAQGLADDSMSDPKDLARIGWAVEHFDSADLIRGKTPTYSNMDGSMADVFLLRTHIDGVFCTALAMPNTSKQRVYVLSAYRDK